MSALTLKALNLALDLFHGDVNGVEKIVGAFFSAQDVAAPADSDLSHLAVGSGARREDEPVRRVSHGRDDNRDRPFFPLRRDDLEHASEPLDADKEALVEKLLVRMQGVSRARECKYIMLHAPKAKLAEVTALLPGAEHPTILPLAGSDDHVALHMVSSESLFWETMEELKALGASSILVLPIEKMME